MKLRILFGGRLALLALPIPIVLGASSGKASAATVDWERAPGAESCVSAADFEREVGARLGRDVAELTDAAQRISVQVRHQGKAWVARVRIDNQRGEVEGERTLKVVAEACSKIEQYAALVVALMLDPNSAGVAEAPPTPVSDTSVPAVDAASSPAPAASQVPPPSHDAERASIAGEGHFTLYVYPAIMPTGNDLGLSTQSVASSLAKLVQRSLFERLRRREQFTLVGPPSGFEREVNARSFIRHIESGKQVPRPEIVANGSVRSAPAPHFVIVPVVRRLTLQRGIDFALGKDPKAWVATVKLTLLVVDVRGERELPDVELTTSVSVLDRNEDPAVEAWTAKVAIEKLADEALEALRRIRAFRSKPKFVSDASGPRIQFESSRGMGEGDAFTFEDDAGRTSGFVVIHDIRPDGARAEIWKSGDGTRLTELHPYRRWAASYYANSAIRLAFAAPSANELGRATALDLRPRHFGSGFEAGLGARGVYAPSSGSGIRGVFDLGWSFMAVDSLALNVELAGGAGYEFRALPSLGLSVMPYAELGGKLIRGSLGEERTNRAYMGSLFAATGQLGMALEFYRLFGSWSLLAASELQFVQPLLSSTPSSEFLDGSYPDLHGLVLKLGIVNRTSAYED